MPHVSTARGGASLLVKTVRSVSRISLSLSLVQKKERSRRFVQTKTRARRSESTKDDSDGKEREKIKENALRVAFASQNFNHADVVYE
jgi:hypothetical protein